MITASLANVTASRLTRLSEEIASTLAKSVRYRSARVPKTSLTEYSVPIPLPSVKVVVSLVKPPQGVFGDREMRRRGEFDMEWTFGISSITEGRLTAQGHELHSADQTGITCPERSVCWNLNHAAIAPHWL